MMKNRQNRRTKRMRLAARIIALAAAGFFLVALIAGAFTADEPFTTEGMLLIIIVGVALAGGILSWWRERLAGILLVVAALAMGAHIAAYAGRNQILVWLTLGLPYLIAGGLFLKCWQPPRSNKSVDKRPSNQSKRTFPSVLWILPIFFGLLGGIIGALIAGLKYEANWWGLLTVGVLINVVVFVILFLI